MDWILKRSDRPTRFSVLQLLCDLQECFRDLFIRLNKKILSVIMSQLIKVEQAYCVI